MALVAAFQTLCVHCQKLHEALEGLRLTVVEDKPLTGDVILVDQLGNTVDDLLGWVEELYNTAAAGHAAVQTSRDVEKARQALIACHQQFHQTSQRFTNDLAAYDRLTEVLALGHGRPGEWCSWARGTKEAIEDCAHYFTDCSHALFVCWQELTEHPGLFVSSRSAAGVE
jgi:hypothetical protein